MGISFRLDDTSMAYMVKSQIELKTIKNTYKDKFYLLAFFCSLINSLYCSIDITVSV